MGSDEITNRRARRFFSLSGIDWDDDASIMRWADSVWRQLVEDQGEDVNEEPAFALTDRYGDAVAYATHLHAAQARKGTAVPYAAHLFGVSSLVLEAGGTEDEAIAGLLHDAVEDGDGLATADEIRERFGDRITDIVLACSDSTDREWKERTPYWERKQRYLDHLEASTDERAVLVSIADKVHNARAIATDLQIHGPEVLSKFNGTPSEILTYYKECLRIGAAKNVPDVLLWPLRTAVSTIEGFVRQANA